MTRTAYENETEARTLAIAGASGISILVLMLLFLITLNNSIPQPPPIEFVEVNFGLDNVGSGKIQTYNKPSDSKRAIDVKKAEDKPNPKVTTTNRVEKTPVRPIPKVEETKVKVSKTIAEKPIIASRTESPVSVPEPRKSEPKKAETPKPVEAPPRAEPPPVKKAEPVDPNALYKRSSGGGGSNGTVGRESGTGGNNNGDNKSGVGDKGNPDGKVDAKEYYGKPGGSSTGVAFNVAGWSIGNKSIEKDASEESGKIVFRIKVDQSGSIVAVNVIETQVSPSITDYYKRQISRLRPQPKSSVVPEISTGTVTINVRSR
jgi:periplasmic protein TonB